jgi:carboxylesterase type B
VPTIFSEDVPEYNIRDVNTTGEDCLTLSIWTPHDGAKEGKGKWKGQEKDDGLPVIVHFYGGGWYTGGQDIAYQIPTQWVQRKRDVIVVVLKFVLLSMSTPILTTMNAATDLVSAFAVTSSASPMGVALNGRTWACWINALRTSPSLFFPFAHSLNRFLGCSVEWIHTNIASFGGDPFKITLWGFSSGAEAVDMYTYAWPNDPLINGIILGSGNALIEDGSGPRYSNFSYVAGQVGCGNLSAEEEFKCVKGVDAAVITKILGDDVDRGSPLGLAFASSADGKVVFSDYAERVRDGTVAKVVSCTSNKWSRLNELGLTSFSRL